MKNLIQSLIKILYVVILPCLGTGSIVYYLYAYDYTAPLLGASLLLLFCVWFNAFFYMRKLSQTRMFPSVKVEVMPIVGFAIGIDLQRAQWILVLPFVCIDFNSKNVNKF